MKPCPLTKLEVINSNEMLASETQEAILLQWFDDCNLKDIGNFWLLFATGSADPEFVWIDTPDYPLTPDEAMVIALMLESAETA